MKQDNLTVNAIKILLLMVITFLMMMILWQNHNIELRLNRLFNAQENFSDTSERLISEVERLADVVNKGGLVVQGNRVEVTEPVRNWIHPEIDNFLKKPTAMKTSPFANHTGHLRQWYGNVGPKGLNPVTESSAPLSDQLNWYVRETLGLRHGYSDPEIWGPMLAERMEITDDYREYTIYLRKGVYWHKPAVDWSDSGIQWLKGEHEFTARDVIFTLDIIMNPQVEAAHQRNYFKDLESYRALDDYTVVLKWKKKTYNAISATLGLEPIPEFLYAYDDDGTRLSREVLGLKFNEHWFNQKTIGTGPYQFVSYESGVSVELRRNESYWGVKPAIKKITWLCYSDDQQNLLKLKSGEQDMGRLTPMQYKEDIKNAKESSPFKNGRIQYEHRYRFGYYYLGWNISKPIFKDARTRRAMTHACNREGILKNVFENLGSLVTGNAYLESPYYDRSITPYPFDLEKSQSLLKEVGWVDIDNDGVLEKDFDGEIKEFEFNLLCYGNSNEWKTLATIYKEDLLKIGIRMNIQTVEWSAMQKKMDDKEFDCYTGGWGLGWSYDPYQLFHSSQADVPKGSNRVGFKHGEGDRIIEDLRVTFELDKRIELAHQYHKILHEEQPYSFLFSQKRTWVWWDYVKNVQFRKLRPLGSSLPWYVDMPAD